MSHRDATAADLPAIDHVFKTGFCDTFGHLYTDEDSNAFLGKFTQGMKWAHLDVAGTAYQGGAQKGSTGRPTPLLADFLIRRAGA